jgi:hypothetical protein
MLAQFYFDYAHLYRRRASPCLFKDTSSLTTCPFNPDLKVLSCRYAVLMLGRCPEAMSWPITHQGNSSGDGAVLRANKLKFFSPLIPLTGTMRSRNCGALPLSPYVQIRCIHFMSRGDPSGNLYLETISTALSCGRERASLTVSNHIR